MGRAAEPGRLVFVPLPGSAVRYLHCPLAAFASRPLKEQEVELSSESCIVTRSSVWVAGGEL